MQTILEGEIYKNNKTRRCILVLGIAEESDSELVLAIADVNLQTGLAGEPGELTIPKTELTDWELVDV